MLSCLEEHQIIPRSAQRGEYSLHRLQILRGREVIGDVGGKGLLAGVEFVRDGETKEAFDPGMKVKALIATKALDKGLIIYPGVVVQMECGEITPSQPPLIIAEDHLDGLISLLDETM